MVALASCLIHATAYKELRGRLAAYRHAFPPQALPLLSNCLTTLAIAAATFFPSFHASYHQALHALYHVSLWFSFHAMRQNVLWLGLLDAEPGAAFLHHVTSFSKENLFTCITWFAAVQMPMGEFLGRVSILAQLLHNLAGNSAICASPLWPRESGSMSPTLLRAAKAVSAGLLELAQPLYGVGNRSLRSCPAVLGVWQVLGSLLAMLAMGAAEIVRRRAFLHKAEVQARLERHDAANALHWPWGGMSLPPRLVGSVVAMILLHAVFWALLVSNMAETEADSL